jgi:sulfatase maturation enzyme AslB (radical SAM superfamily)
MAHPKLGNIYETPLKELANSPAVLETRRASMEDKLNCLTTCNLINYKKQPIEPVNEFVDYYNMSYLHLNFGHYCNIRCDMCKIQMHLDENKSILDPNILKKNIDLSPFKEIVIQGGEPLFIPECKEYLDFLGQIGKKYVLLTNGILINDNMAHQLARDADRVVISINAATKVTHEIVNRGSNFEMVKNNIQKMRIAREDEGTDLLLNGRMTLTIHALHEIPLFIQKYKELGFDTINFGYDRATVPSYLAANPDLKAQLSKDIMGVLEHAELADINLLRLEQLGLTPKNYSEISRGF